MKLRRVLLVCAAFAFAAALNAYLFMHAWLNGQNSAAQVSEGECEDGTQALQQSKTNPNKMLFISCGGFLD